MSSRFLSIEFTIGLAMSIAMLVIERSGKSSVLLNLALLSIMGGLLIHPALHIPWIWSQPDIAIKTWRAALIVCAIVFGVSWFGIWTWPDSKTAHSNTSLSDPAIPAMVPLAGGIGEARVPSSTTTPSTAPLSPKAREAQEVIDHYKRTSQTLRQEEIQEGYRVFCENIVAKMSPKINEGWSGIEGLVRQAHPETADQLNPYQDPRRNLQGRYPGTTGWGVIRIVVSFSSKSLPAYTSFVCVGRTPAGKEIVAFYATDKRELSILSDGNKPATHEKLITDTVGNELDRLTDKMIADIRALE